MEKSKVSILQDDKCHIYDHCYIERKKIVILKEKEVCLIGDLTESATKQKLELSLPLHGWCMFLHKLKPSFEKYECNTIHQSMP